MGANLRCEKNSLALLSSMRTKAFSKNRADEAFALPPFLDAMPMLPVESSNRSGQELRLEHHASNVEKLKQTMLQHESMFKEQLYELHRLYQVQRLLMEESKRKSFIGHPHSDSPSSNSSFLYNPDSGRPKEERMFWDVNNASKLMQSKQLSFFSGQIDVNKPFEDRHYADQGADSSSQRRDGHRPVFDLERPAEELMETEVDEKPFFRSSFSESSGNPQLSHLNLQDSQCSFVSLKSEHVAMHEESICRQFPSSTKWRSFEDRFTIEHSRRREVPFFSVGSSTSRNCLAGESSLSPSRDKPVTSLFGVKLNPDINNRYVESPVVHSNLDHTRGQQQTSSTCDRLTGQTSNLPHWLLQGLQTTCATKTSPINLAPQSQHQSSPFFLQKQAEKTVYSEGRFSSSYTQEELSRSWVKSGGGFPFGETFLSRPQCMPSPVSFLDTLTGHVQGYHKSAQASSVNGSVPLVSPPSMSAPKINKMSSGSETDVAPALLLKELSSRSKNSGSPVAPWYQQRASSPLTPNVSKAGAKNERPPNAFSVNSLVSWGNVPAHEQVQEGIFTKSTKELGEGTSQGIASFPLSVKRPEAFSKRLIFSFMPTAADLDLTLGLDLNEDGASEIRKTIEDSFNESVAQRQDNICLQTKLVRNDFDLNEQLGHINDAESHATQAGSKHESEVHTRLAQGMSTGVRATYFEQWQTSHHSSSLKIIPEETSASTETPRQATAASGGNPDDKQFHAARANGGSFVAGRSSDGSGLASCESRSSPIPALAKSRDDSTVSGGACQSMPMRQWSQEMFFEDDSTVAEKKQGFFSLMSEVTQSETAEKKLPIEKCMLSKDEYATAGNIQATKHKAEAYKAADILLLLSLDSRAEGVEDRETDGDHDKALKWLADIIPQDDIYGIDGSKACVTGGESLRGSSECHPQSIGVQEKVLDSFELSVLNLKPMDPDNETICPHPIQRYAVEECLAPANLRRRSLRRGRLVKDFQKETLPSIASLSRQEITEDLQILEGLVKSATEAMARCSLSSKEDVSSWSLPALLSSAKTPAGKAKGFRSCSKAAKQNGLLLRVCSWGESTRRRRMQRQRRVCLPPAIQTPL